MHVQRLTLILSALILLGFGTQHGLGTPSTPPFGVYEDAEFSPTITIIESNESVIRLQLVMDNLRDPAQSIDLTQRPDGAWVNMNQDVTYPLMPRFTIYLALPETGDPQVEIDDWQMQTYDVSSPRTIPENDPDEPRVRAGTVGVLGGVRIFPLTIKPITYVDNTETCEVVVSAEVTINISGDPGLFPLEEARQSFSQPWQRVFQSLVTNWEYIPNIDNGVQSHLLIITTDEFRPYLEDFIAWKEQRGMIVTPVSLSEIGGNPSAIMIRNRIVDEYENSDPPVDFVLFTGDESEIPVSMRNTSDPTSRFSDYSIGFGSYTDEGKFRAIIGNDNQDVFPDVFMGRWVVSTISEVLTVANRTIYHERDPLVGNSDRFERCVVSADFSEPTMQVTKSYVRERLLDHGFSEVDTIWAVQAPGPQGMINAVNEGVTFVNHRGAGWNFGWAGINFYIPNVSSIVNTGRLPVITGIGCGVAKFDEADNNCFGEVWMTRGTVTQPSGAVGFIGPSWNTHTVYNNCLDSSIYKAILDHDVLNLGAALESGKMYTWGLMEDFLDETAVLELCQTMFRQYQVLSDPSLQLYTQTPAELAVDLPEAIPDGPYNLPVSVANMPQLPADSLLLTVWYEEGNFEAVWITPDEPSITVPVNGSSDQSVIVTLSGDNIAAFQQELQVNPEGPYVSHLEAILDDIENGNGNGLLEPGETIEWTESAWNIGSEAAENVTATLSTFSDLIDISVDETNLGTIESNETVNADTPFELSVAAGAPDTTAIRFDVLYNPTNGGLRSSRVVISLYAPDIEIVTVVVEDGNNGLLERWEGADLRISLENAGNLPNTTGSFSLSSADPYITIVNGSGTLPQLSPDTPFLTPAADLHITASGVTPSAHLAELTLHISAQMDNYSYEVDLPFTLQIGQVSATDPLADTESRYWMYDNTDVIYSQGQREFEWIEIASSADGPGTEVLPLSSQHTFPIPVPFEFDYYGITYDTLSISTDGWVKPGRTSFTAFVNYELPYFPDNVRGMVAPLWDDLWYRFNDQETGELCYYYDEETDRFIVEWYNVHHWQYLDFAETFQVQLLNPETYPTSTGDAEWVFIYDDISALPTSSIGATVGLESPDGYEGATYVFETEYNDAAAALEDGRVILITPEPPMILDADDDLRQVALPREISLGQNYPNPFNPETKIRFALPSAMDVRLEIFNILGQRVATLVNSRVSAGEHVALWDGRTEAGIAAGSGVYLYRLVTPQTVQSRKMIMLK